MSKALALFYHTYANNDQPAANSSYPLAIAARYSESYGVQWLQKVSLSAKY